MWHRIMMRPNRHIPVSVAVRSVLPASRPIRDGTPTATPPPLTACASVRSWSRACARPQGGCQGLPPPLSRRRVRRAALLTPRGPGRPIQADLTPRRESSALGRNRSPPAKYRGPTNGGQGPGCAGFPPTDGYQAGMSLPHPPTTTSTMHPHPRSLSSARPPRGTSRAHVISN